MIIPKLIQKYITNWFQPPTDTVELPNSTVNKDFKSLILEDIIPTISSMIDRQKSYVQWLKDNNVDARIIYREEWYLNHYQQRYFEYNEYVKKMN